MRYSHVALEQRTRLWQTSWDRLGSQGMVRTVQVRSLDQLSELVDALGRLPHVVGVRRDTMAMMGEANPAQFWAHARHSDA